MKKRHFEAVSTIVNGSPPRSKKTEDKVMKVIMGVSVVMLVIGAYLLGARSCQATCPRLTPGEPKTNNLTENSKPGQLPKKGSKTTTKTTETRPAHESAPPDQNLPKPQATQFSENPEEEEGQILDFYAIPIAFGRSGNKWTTTGLVDVNPEAVFWVIRFWQVENTEKIFGYKMNQQIKTDTMSYNRIKGDQGNYLWHSKLYHSSKKVKKLAEGQIGLIACIAGEQFYRCGKENYACAAVFPGDNFNSDLIKKKSNIVISYFLNERCEFKAYLNAHPKGD